MIWRRFFYSLLLQVLCCYNFSYAQQLSFLNKEEFPGNTTHFLFSDKIYLHSDKNFYLAGEIIWFKLYYMNGNNQPANVSKVAYVEILDRSNKAVLQTKVLLTTNGGIGSFYLPLSINSDYYVLRAYTNWMKNAGSSIFFEKKISVVNTMKATTERNVPVEEAKIEISFLPESGRLVEDIETKVAFRVTDSHGKGINSNGVITDYSGDTVLRFSSYRFGMGSFFFRPSPGKNYKATLLLPNGKLISQPFIPSEKSGYVMNVMDNNDGRLKLKIQARFSGKAEAGEQIFLLAHNNQSVKVLQQQYLSYTNELLLFIDKTKLGEGVNHITLLNKDKQPVAERLVFIRPRSAISAEINTGKQLYGTRQPVDISVLFKGVKQDEDINYSMSVYQVDSLEEKNSMNICSYLLLLSDLKGNIESPEYYFSINNSEVDEAMDNLLLVHGWRRFKDGSVRISSTKEGFDFLPEYGGHFITGKVINITNGDVVANANCFLTTPAEPFGFHISRSDNTGKVRFEVKNYYGPGEIIGQVAESDKAKYRIDFLSPFSDDSSLLKLSGFLLSQKYADRLLHKSISMQAQNIYRGDSMRRFAIPNLSDTLPFFGKAEFEYKLDEYKRFTTMEEVLREYVSPINVVLRDGKLHLNIFDESSRQIYYNDILVLLDGVPIQDYNKIFSFDPLKVKKLAIVPRRYLYGVEIFSGIASFETYNRRFSGFELDPSLIAVNYEGLQMQREFYSPHYNTTSNSKIPDLRTTLFWAPELLSASSKKAEPMFYTSDIKGKFMVVLEGISTTGRPVAGSVVFDVQ